MTGLWTAGRIRKGCTMEEKINELLAAVISGYGPQFGRKFVKKLAKELEISTVEAQLESGSGDSYALLKKAFADCGTILKELPSEGIIGGVILSGVAKMNPAFLALQLKEGQVYLKAWAKEGLIKQHTAERAIEAFRLAFAEAEKPA